MRHLTTLFLGFLGAAIFHISLGQLAPQAIAGKQDIVSARAFHLTDSNGRKRMTLGFSKEGPPAFWMFDPQGKARISIGMYRDGTGYIGLQDQNNQMTQLLRSYGAKQTPLHIFKINGQDKMILGLNPNSTEPFLTKYPNGKPAENLFGSFR